MIDLKKVPEALEKSGFVLEHQITEKLIGAKWNVINNKYYLDDVQEIAREIDLLAYKVRKFRCKHPEPFDIFVYTTLIVSCKKNEDNFWSLLFRDCDEKNPNFNWFPVKNWSNDDVTKYLIRSGEAYEGYKKEAVDSGLFENIFKPSGHLFAFQEINKTRYTVQNDKTIFGAIAGLMKAESYEMEMLSSRNERVSLYNFNLLSVVDTELVKVHYNGDKTTVEQIDDANGVFNFIVKKRQTESRIHFVTLKGFDDALVKYDKLSKFNTQFFSTLRDKFFEDSVSEMKKSEILKEFYSTRLGSKLISPYFKHFRRYKPMTNFVDYLSKYNDMLTIHVDAQGEEITFLNTDSKVLELTANLNKQVFNYDGKFKFEDKDEIPF